MEPTACAAIVNPAAGRGKAARVWRDVAARLRTAGVSVTVHQTSGPGDGERLARAAIDAGANLLVAVGGDGTAHEVVNALLLDGEVRSDVRFALIPAGTGMDLARNLAFERGVEAAARRLISPRERRVDLGLATWARQRLFVNFAETGLGASVVARVAGFNPALPGRLSFLLASLEAARSEKLIRARIEVDDQILYQGPLVSVVIANGAHFGGGMKIAPGARMDDGQLDVVVLADLTPGELARAIWQVYPGIHVRHPKVLYVRGTDVQVTPDDASRLDLDGELVGSLPSRFAVLPKALRVIT